MKNIIITGAYGQDGLLLSKIFKKKKKFRIFGLVKNLKKKKINNINYIKISINKFNVIKKLFDTIKPDVIIHLGSDNPSFKKSFKIADYKKNFNFTKKIVNYVIKSKKIKLIFPSSSQIYPFSKKKINENKIYRPTSYYTKFRIDASKYILERKKKHGLNASVVILFNHDSIYRNPRFLLPRLINAIKRRNYTFLKKIYYANISGDFSHAEDICYGIYQLINKDLNPDKLIFSSGKRTYINSIIEHFIPKFKNMIDKKKIVISRSNIGDNFKAVRILNWKIKKSYKDAANELYRLNKLIMK